MEAGLVPFLDNHRNIYPSGHGSDWSWPSGHRWEERQSRETTGEGTAWR